MAVIVEFWFWSKYSKIPFLIIIFKVKGDKNAQIYKFETQKSIILS